MHNRKNSKHSLKQKKVTSKNKNQPINQTKKNKAKMQTPYKHKILNQK